MESVTKSHWVLRSHYESITLVNSFCTFYQVFFTATWEVRTLVILGPWQVTE